jgi:hypothetical protein
MRLILPKYLSWPVFILKFLLGYVRVLQFSSAVRISLEPQQRNPQIATSHYSDFGLVIAGDKIFLTFFKKFGEITDHWNARVYYT